VFKSIKEGKMLKSKHYSAEELVDPVDKYGTNNRLNLNVLLEKRKKEKAVDKRNNVFIYSGTAAVALVILLLLISF